jgi:hypothetical protein
MAVEATLALYGACSLYNWVANVISRPASPQQAEPARLLDF